MRRLTLISTALVTSTIADAAFACRPLPPSQRGTWVRHHAAKSAVVLDATVSRAQNNTTGETARLVSRRRYKGPAQAFYDMAPPIAAGEVITHAYNGLGEPSGSRGFFVLYSHPDGYRTDPCVDANLSNPAIRRAFLQHVR